MKRMITKTIEIKLSGKDLADELWELDCQEQADFFNKNGFVIDDFNHGYAITQIDRLTELAIISLTSLTSIILALYLTPSFTANSSK